MPDVTSRPVTIWSEGTRLAGDLWLPEGAGNDGSLPAILLCHGWGGLKEHLNRAYAPFFCSNGFVCLTFDYRGWGESDGKLIKLDGDALTQTGVVSVRGRVVREVVDPFDQALDIVNAFNFLAGEPTVDTERMGVWGSSFGGGHVVYFAAQEPRVRAVVAQVGGYGPPDSTDFAERARARAIEKARGDLDPPIPQGVDAVPGLKGTPDIAKMWFYRPRDQAAKVQVPTLIIDAESEELVDRRQHGQLVYERISASGVAARYETYPCTHYGIYDECREEASNLALEWFREHL